MATKPTKPVPPFHWFTSSMLNWAAYDDRAKCERMQRQADDEGRGIAAPNGYNVWRVPGRCAETQYEIRHFAPQVEGAEFIEFVRYPEQRKSA